MPNNRVQHYSRVKTQIQKTLQEKKAKDPIGTLFVLWNRFIWKKDQHGGFSSTRRRILVFFAIGLLILSKLSAVQVPLIFKKLVDATLDHSSTVLIFDYKMPFFLLIAWTVARFVSILSGELRNVLFSQVTQGIIRDINRFAFEHLSKVQEEQRSKNLPTISMIKTLDRGTRALQGLTTSLLLNIIPTCLECAIVTGMLWKHFGINVAAIGIGGILLYSALTIFISEWRLSVRAAMNAAEIATSSSLLETVANSETIHTTPNAKRFEKERHEHLLKNYENCALKTASSLALLNAVQGILITTSMAGMLALGLTGVATTPGDLVLMHGLLFQLASPLGFLGTSYREGRQSVADVEAVFDILQHEKKQVQLSILNTSLKFRRTLLVGSSGGGKSTLARHLAMELGTQAIWVPQDVSQLFSKTVFYNIAYGINFSNDFTYTDDFVTSNNLNGFPESKACKLEGNDQKNSFEPEVIKVVKEAMMATNLPMEMISREVGERGCNLSGGERQRILIARAFARLLSFKEKIQIKAIILDEPTAWLDGPTEIHVLEKLFLFAKDIPVVVATHSIQAIAPYSDHVLVISSEGNETVSDDYKVPRIIQEGYWKDLLSIPGPFASLWNAEPYSKKENSGQA